MYFAKGVKPSFTKYTLARNDRFFDSLRPAANIVCSGFLSVEQVLVSEDHLLHIVLVEFGIASQADVGGFLCDVLGKHLLSAVQ